MGDLENKKDGKGDDDNGKKANDKGGKKQMEKDGIENGNDEGKEEDKNEKMKDINEKEKDENEKEKKKETNPDQLNDATGGKRNREDLDEDGNDKKRQSIWIPGVRHKEYHAYEEVAREKGIEGWKRYLEEKRKKN